MLSREELQQVSDELEGTCRSVESVLEQLGLAADPTEVEDQLVDLNLELCPGCGWWMESSELIDANDNVVGCDQCRPAQEPED